MIENIQLVSSLIAAIGGVLGAYFAYQNKINQKKYKKQNEQLRFYIKQSLVYHKLEEELYNQIIMLDNNQNQKSLKIETRKKVLVDSDIKIDNFKRPSNMKNLLHSIEDNIL